MERNTDRGIWSILVLLIAIGIGVSLTVVFTQVSAYIQGVSKSFVKEVQEITGIKYEKLEFSMDEIAPWGSENFERISDTSFILGTSDTYRSGIKVPAEYFDYGEEYKVSFDITLLEGVMEAIGGHLFFSDDVSITIDDEIADQVWGKGAVQEIESDGGVNINLVNNWALGVELDAKLNKKYHIELVFTKNIKNLAISDENLYIQPNRTRGSHWIENKLSCKVLIEDLIIERHY